MIRMQTSTHSTTIATTQRDRDHRFVETKTSCLRTMATVSRTHCSDESDERSPSRFFFSFFSCCGLWSSPNTHPNAPPGHNADPAHRHELTRNNSFSHSLPGMLGGRALVQKWLLFLF